MHSWGALQGIRSAPLCRTSSCRRKDSQRMRVLDAELPSTSSQQSHDDEPSASDFSSKQRFMYREECEDFMSTAADILNTYLLENLDDSQPVSQLRSPSEIEAAFIDRSGISLRLSEDQPPEDVGSLTRAFRTTLDYSTRTGHDLFFNQLYARAEPMGIAGDWLAAATSTNVHIYEVSPVFTLMEQEVLKKLASYLGGDYAREGGWDGLLVPGGAVANLYAMLLAQNEHDPERRERGAAGGPVLVAFCSEQAHFSFEKAAHATGLGARNLVKVRTDAHGAMCPRDLEEKVAQAALEGKRPFFVGATSGTTVRGAFDPLPALTAVCRRHGLWLHVDGAWGAAALLSRQQRHLLAGVDQADSVSWSAHKIMGMSMQCSAILVRDRSLARANGTGAEYLFQPDRPTASLDIGDKTIMCGRRAEAIKLWLTWKRVGDLGWEQRVDHAVQLACEAERVVTESVRGAPELLSTSGTAHEAPPPPPRRGVFVPVFPRSFLNVCFWYIPPRMRPLLAEFGPDPRAWPDAHREALHKVAPALKRRMLDGGDAMISFQPQGGGVPNFFRLVFANAGRISPGQVRQLFTTMDEHGADV